VRVVIALTIVTLANCASAGTITLSNAFQYLSVSASGVAPGFDLPVHDQQSFSLDRYDFMAVNDLRLFDVHRTGFFGDTYQATALGQLTTSFLSTPSSLAFSADGVVSASSSVTGTAQAGASARAETSFDFTLDSDFAYRLTGGTAVQLWDASGAGYVTAPEGVLHAGLYSMKLLASEQSLHMDGVASTGGSTSFSASLNLDPYAAIVPLPAAARGGLALLMGLAALRVANKLKSHRWLQRNYR
jgi:hypothetical protein